MHLQGTREVQLHPGRSQHKGSLGIFRQLCSSLMVWIWRCLTPPMFFTAPLVAPTLMPSQRKRDDFNFMG